MLPVLNMAMVIAWEAGRMALACSSQPSAQETEPLTSGFLVPASRDLHGAPKDGIKFTFNYY